MSLSKVPAERVVTTSTTVPFTTPTESPPPIPSLTSSKPSSSSSSSASISTSSTAPSSQSSTSSSARHAPALSSSSSSSSPALPAPLSPRVAQSVSAAEYRNAHKWDACVENTLVKTGYGLLLAGAAALLLFRSPAARSCVAGLGGGFGAGMSWVECKQSFAADAVVRPQLSTLHIPRLPDVSAATTSTPSSKSVTLTAERK